MPKPRKTVFNGDLERLLADEHRCWTQLPSYGMPEVLNRHYHKLKTKYSLCNAKMEFDKSEICHLIQQILQCESIVFVNKLYLIDEFIGINKDYFDNYDTIIDTAIDSEINQ